MKKIASVIILVLLIPSLAFYCLADENPLTIQTGAQFVADSQISSFGTYELQSVSPLYNINSDLEALCFNYSPSGYVIVNVNDFSIPEFSPSSTTPFPYSDSANSSYVYNGPLNYFSYDNIKYTNLTSGNCYIYEDFVQVYSIDFNSQSQEKALFSNRLTRGSSVEVTTSYLPVTWTSSAYCGVDACAIILKYLHDHKDYDLLATDYNECNELHSFLISACVIPDTGTDANDLVAGCTVGLTRYVGLNRFFEYRESSIRASSSTYSFSLHSDIQSAIWSDYPMIIGTDPASDWSYDDHWVIVYGYYGSTYIDYFIINDGWGRNGIYVTSAENHYDDIIFFN